MAALVIGLNLADLTFSNNNTRRKEIAYYRIAQFTGKTIGFILLMNFNELLKSAFSKTCI